MSDYLWLLVAFGTISGMVGLLAVLSSEGLNRFLDRIFRKRK